MKKIIKKLIWKIYNRYKIFEMKNYVVYKNAARLHLGNNVSAVNTLFNTSSGHIYVGDNTIFGHNCMVITGRHEFVDGKRKSLVIGGTEAPTEGFDIHIGQGCWIASGAIINGGVRIGDNVIIGAGAVVTKDIPSSVFAAGVPAKIIKKMSDLPEI